jgi:hypothetical protein
VTASILEAKIRPGVADLGSGWANRIKPLGAESSALRANRTCDPAIEAPLGVEHRGEFGAEDLEASEWL